MASALGGIGSLLEGLGSSVEQIFVWNVMGQVLGVLLTPYLTQAGYDVLQANQIIQISVAEAAEQVLKTILTPEEGQAVAAKYGIPADVFDRMVKNVGEPPGIIQVLEWWRRGFIPWDGGEIGKPGVVQAVQTSRIRNEWTEVLRQAQYVPISAADAVNAWIRNQVDAATAQQILTWNGIEQDQQQILYDTAGRPPAPMEAASLVHRGAIPVHGTGPQALTFQQAIMEGDLKDKWEPPMEALLVNIPGVFEIRQIALAGGISPEVAAKYYAMLGLPQDLIPGLVASGQGIKIAAHKNLTESLLLKLYADKILTAAEVSPMLEALGYDATEVHELLLMQDEQTELKNIDSAVTRARSLFLARKVSAQGVQDLLTGWGLPATTAQSLVTLWRQEQGASPRVLTEAQVVDALDYGILDQATAMTYLEALGYTPYDAWVLISVKLKSPQGTPPAEGATVTGRAV